MEFKQLEQFLAVVDHGGLVRAAAALHMAQPSLSQTVRVLERELKTPLFHRVGRGLVLTAAGEALVAPARQLMRDVATARASVAEVSGIRTARLDIAAMGGPLELILPVLSEFRLRHPDVVLRLETPALEAELVQRISEGRSELGFLPLEEQAGIPPVAGQRGLETVRLGLESIKLVLPPGIGRDLPDPLPLARLPEFPVVGAPAGAQGRDIVENALRRAGVRTRMAVATAHRYTQADFVLHGVGMAFIPESQTGRALRAGASARDLEPPIQVPNGVVRRAGFLSPAAQVLLDLATERLRAPRLAH